MAIYIYDNKILTEGNAIATHEDCCCETATDWINCSGGAVVATVLDSAAPPVNYAWLCIAGVYVACQKSTGSTLTPSSPSYILQCGTTPTSCAGLIGWHVSDNLSGTGSDCNSVSVGDSNWIRRWNYVSGNAPTIVSGELRYVGLNAGYSASNIVFPAMTDFSVTLTGRLSGTMIPTSLMQFGLFELNAWWQLSIASGVPLNNLYYDGTAYRTGSSNTSTPTWNIRRTGSTISFYLNGTLQTFTATSSTNLTTLWVRTYGDDYVAFYDNLLVNDNSNGDGTGNPVYIVPTGEACT